MILGVWERMFRTWRLLVWSIASLSVPLSRLGPAFWGFFLGVFWAVIPSAARGKGFQERLALFLGFLLNLRPSVCALRLHCAPSAYSDFGLTSFAGLHRLPDCPRAIRQTSPLRTSTFGLRAALALRAFGLLGLRLDQLRRSAPFVLALSHYVRTDRSLRSLLGQTSPLRTSTFGLRATLAAFNCK